MVPAREPKSGPTEDEAGVFERTSRKKKKKGRAVSIRKGNLLFFPTALPDEPEGPEGKDEPTEPVSNRTKLGESEGS